MQVTGLNTPIRQVSKSNPTVSVSSTDEKPFA